MSSDAIQIRRATEEDAKSILHTHLASIQGLCAGDYSAREIEAWTGPKRAEQYVSAMRDNHAVFVATDAENHIVGFADRGGEEIFGLYVAPDRAGRGVGRQLLAAVEDDARSSGATKLTLKSTLTAKPFYMARGYRIIEQTTHNIGADVQLRCISMEKSL